MGGPGSGRQAGPKVDKRRVHYDRHLGMAPGVVECGVFHRPLRETAIAKDVTCKRCRLALIRRGLL